MTGIKPPNYIHGKSLVPVLKNSKKHIKNEIYTRYKQGEAVIDKDFSYTEFYQGKEYLGNMLFDLNKDKRQNIDISKLLKSEALVKKYSKKLKVMRDFVNKDPLENK